MGFSPFSLPKLICTIDSASVNPSICFFFDALVSSASEEVPESVTSLSEKIYLQEHFYSGLYFLLLIFQKL